ncbi:protein of unknown function [Thermoanaerobacter uzonensis DSM 18761]|uniref:DUF7768 domain-containing protein n=1 Tax=Thermoanaerobacter uzonensis DSM 18761 TaxID=1123369 RepID=A0A1M5AKP8_9THEO|nr:DUF4406 domain-containing protein [Thermoanaerobacter uzonensis]SHF30829.1 protein of unknown function [Thermoanaerobacter uzonensis DSM 18761]
MSKFVYICHPYSANPAANRVKFDKIFRFIRNNFKEVVPFSPVHAFSEFYDDRKEEDRKEVLKLCTDVLKKCDEVWVFGNWESSEGCRLEVKTAEESGIKIKFFNDEEVGL